MPSRIHCPSCKTAFAYSPALLGKTVRCKTCQHTFKIEAPPPEDSAVAGPASTPAPAPTPAASAPSAARAPGPPPLPSRPAASSSKGSASKADTSRRDEVDDDDRPPVGRDYDDKRPARRKKEADRDEEDDDDRPSRRSSGGSRAEPPPAPAPDRSNATLVLVGLIAAFIVGFILLAAGIAYILWPSSTPSSTQLGPAPVAPPDGIAAANPPQNLNEILNEAPNGKGVVAGPPPIAGPPPAGPPVFDMPGFEPPVVNRPPRAPRPPAFVPPGRPEDAPKIARPAPEFAGVDPLPIQPTPLAATRVERAMPAPIESMVVAGAGRLLLLHLPNERRVAVVDLNRGERVKLIPAEDPAARIAGGMNFFVIYLPGKGVLERWSCKSLEREAELKTTFPAEVLALAMGSASNGPLVAALGGGRNTFHGGATLGYFDPMTGQEVEYEITGDRNPFGLGLHNKEATAIRVSADGSVVTGFGGGGGVQADVLAGGRITRHWKHIGFNALLPGPDGRTIYDAGRRFGTDLNAERVVRNPNNDQLFFIPAVQGDFYLSLRMSAERGGPRKAVVDVAVGDEVKSILSLGELANFEMGNGFFDARGKTYDQNLVLVPAARVIAVVPPRTPDRLVLYRADLDAALTRAGVDYLFVSSRPPTVAIKGQKYQYAMVIQSKKGGVKVSVESGPKGLAVTPAGLVTWDVPSDFAESNVGVILQVKDASMKELFHTFRLSVRGKTGMADPGKIK